MFMTVLLKYKREISIYLHYCNPRNNNILFFEHASVSISRYHTYFFTHDNNVKLYNSIYIV